MVERATSLHGGAIWRQYDSRAELSRAITALIAELMLQREPGATIIYDVRASWAVPETIERAGGVPLVNRVGHAFIKHRMREEHAAFGGKRVFGPHPFDMNERAPPRAKLQVL